MATNGIYYDLEISPAEDDHNQDPLEQLEYIIKEEIEDTEELPSDEQGFSSHSAEGSKGVWLDSSTSLLVSLVEQMMPQIGRTIPLHTKKKMWEAIQTRMTEDGYDFTVAQVESKYRALERKYRKTMSQNKLLGTSNTCPFQQQIETIMGVRKRVFPKFLLDEPSSNLFEVYMNEQDGEEESTSSQKQSVTRTVAINSPTISTAQPEEHPKSDLPINKRTRATSILKELRLSRAERKEFHTKVLQYLQKTEKRAQRKEARDVRKLELLERLVRMKQN